LSEDNLVGVAGFEPATPSSRTSMTPANYLILLARLVTKLENISRTSRCFCAISVPQRPPRLRKERRGRSAFGTEMAQKRPPVRCAGRLATHPHDITSNALCARLITKRLAFRRVGVYFVWRFTVAGHSGNLKRSQRVYHNALRAAVLTALSLFGTKLAGGTFVISAVSPQPSTPV